MVHGSRWQVALCCLPLMLFSSPCVSRTFRSVNLSTIIASSVTAGAPADQAGLKVGDIVTEVDGFVVLENDDMVEYVRSKAVGDVVEFTVYREGEYLTIPVAIGDMNKFGN